MGKPTTCLEDGSHAILGSDDGSKLTAYAVQGHHWAPKMFTNLQFQCEKEMLNSLSQVRRADISTKFQP